jgi:hypothetical protein
MIVVAAFSVIAGGAEVGDIPGKGHRHRAQPVENLAA